MQPNPAANKPHSVILSETPVARWHLWKPTRAVSVIVVYSTVDGTVECPGRPLTRMEALSGRYKTMYEVDSAHLAVRITEPLPSRDDSFLFTVNAVVGWRIVDAIQVIKERVDGRIESAVVNHIRFRMREISRKYDIEDFAPVEDGINRLVASGPISLANLGVIIDSVSAHISHDNDTKRHLREKKEIERRIALGQQSHVLNTQEQRHAQALERERMEAVAAGVQGEFGLITMFLRHHPDQSIQVLQMLHARQVELEQRHEARFANSAAMFDKMLEHDLIQDVDIEPIRDAALRNLLATVTGTAPQPQVTLNGVVPAPAPPPAPAQVHYAQAGAPPPELVPAPPSESSPGAGNTYQSGNSSGVTGWRERRRQPGPGNGN